MKHRYPTAVTTGAGPVGSSPPALSDRVEGDYRGVSYHPGIPGRVVGPPALDSPQVRYFHV